MTDADLLLHAEFCRSDKLTTGDRLFGFRLHLAYVIHDERTRQIEVIELVTTDQQRANRNAVGLLNAALDLGLRSGPPA